MGPPADLPSTTTPPSPVGTPVATVQPPSLPRSMEPRKIMGSPASTGMATRRSERVSRMHSGDAVLATSKSEFESESREADPQSRASRYASRYAKSTAAQFEHRKAESNTGNALSKPPPNATDLSNDLSSAREQRQLPVDHPEVTHGAVAKVSRGAGFWTDLLFDVQQRDQNEAHGVYRESGVLTTLSDSRDIQMKRYMELQNQAPRSGGYAPVSNTASNEAFNSFEVTANNTAGAHGASVGPFAPSAFAQQISDAPFPNARTDTGATMAPTNSESNRKRGEKRRAPDEYADNVPSPTPSTKSNRTLKHERRANTKIAKAAEDELAPGDGDKELDD